MNGPAVSQTKEKVRTVLANGAPPNGQQPRGTLPQTHGNGMSGSEQPSELHKKFDQGNLRLHFLFLFGDPQSMGTQKTLKWVAALVITFASFSV